MDRRGETGYCSGMGIADGEGGDMNSVGQKLGIESLIETRIYSSVHFPVQLCVRSMCDLVFGRVWRAVGLPDEARYWTWGTDGDLDAILRLLG